MTSTKTELGFNWELATPVLKSEEMEEALQKNVSSLTVLLPQLLQFAKCTREKWHVLVVVLSDNDRMDPGVILPKEVIRFLSKIHADIGFSYYYLGEYKNANR